AQGVAADTRTAGPEERTSPSRPRLTPAPRAPGFEGTLLGGDFKLGRKLASGGTCDVYEATQLSLSRTVAVKLFRREGGAAARAPWSARPNQEARVLAQFSCPQIVQILAAGEAPAPGGGATAWMAMEHMGGGDLARYVRHQGPPLIDVGLRWLRDALEGLA